MHGARAAGDLDAVATLLTAVTALEPRQSSETVRGLLGVHGGPRGARLARLLAAQRLDEWGYPYATGTHEAVVLIVAELAANAVRRGHVPGRDFRLRLAAAPAVIRVEVTDTRTEKRPAPALPAEPAPLAEAGRRLLLVARLATRWAVTPRPDAPGKTVWAEYAVP